MIGGLLKLFILTVFISIFSSCTPYGGYYNGYNFVENCVTNPYTYYVDPKGWQIWEQENYYISCTKMQYENPMGMRGNQYNRW